MDDDYEHDEGPGPLKLLGRYLLGLGLGVAAGSTLLPLAASEGPGSGNGSSGLGAWGWVLAFLTIILGGAAVMATWALLSGWLDTRATRRRRRRGSRRHAPRSTAPRQVPYWLQIASTVVGMVTGIVGMVMGLAS
jgi:hypothetical protein